MHLVAEETGTADVDTQRLVSQPVVLTPDDAVLHVIGQLIEKDLFAQGHLGAVFGANQHLEVGLLHDRDDRSAQLRVVMLFHLVVTLLLHGIKGTLLVNRPIGRNTVTRNTAEELTTLEAPSMQESLSLLLIA